MFGWLSDLFSVRAPAPTVLDHLPVSGAFVDADGNRCSAEKPQALGEGLSHRQKLELAAQRAGAPFKCAADGLPRVITKNGCDVVVGSKPRPVPPSPNVTSLDRKARA